MQLVSREGQPTLNPSCPYPGNGYPPDPKATNLLNHRQDTTQDAITTIHRLCEDFSKAIGHPDDLRVGISTAEAMTVALVAATSFGAHIDEGRLFLHEYAHLKKTMLGKRAASTAASTPSSPRSGGYCWGRWLEPSRSATPIGGTWWTPCRWPPATMFASAAVGSIPPKKAPERSEATSRASDPTSTALGCVRW